MVVPFAAIVAQAVLEQVAIPLLVRVFRNVGCEIADCPDEAGLEAAEEERLQPADMPTGEPQLAARDRIVARARRLR